MKVKLSWITMAVLLVTIGGYVGPRLKYWFPSMPGFTEAARAEQATPEATANAMFQAIDQGGAQARGQWVLHLLQEYGRSC